MQYGGEEGVGPSFNYIYINNELRSVTGRKGAFWDYVEKKGKEIKWREENKGKIEVKVELCLFFFYIFQKTQVLDLFMIGYTTRLMSFWVLLVLVILFSSFSSLFVSIRCCHTLNGIGRERARARAMGGTTVEVWGGPKFAKGIVGFWKCAICGK